MTLFLVESLSGNISNKEDLQKKVDQLQNHLTGKDATLIEVQVGTNFERIFFIIEASEENVATESVKAIDIEVDLVKEVRLIGEDLEDVKKENELVNYIVEWNLPEDLTMEQYLARKEKNSVHYEEVPEVSFARTYVCEDMTKCLCFYDAPDEEAVKKAREVVQAPIDSITKLD